MIKQTLFSPYFSVPSTSRLDLADQNHMCKTPSRELCSVSQQFATPHLISTVQKPFQHAQVPQQVFSTPNAPTITVLPQINATPIQEKSACGGKQSANCPVTVKIDWSTKSKTKVLPDELSSLGKMLCRGTYKQIARAAWTCKALQKYLLQEIAKQVHKECGALCSKGINKQNKKRQDSCLRKTDKESMLRFSFENLDKELEGKAPLFHLVLKTAALRREDNEKAWLPSVGMAAAVCLKNKSRDMTAVQLLITLINRHSGFLVKIFLK